MHLSVHRNLSAKSLRNTPASRFAIILERSSAVNSQPRLAFPLIRVPKERGIVEIYKVEVSGWMYATRFGGVVHGRGNRLLSWDCKLRELGTKSPDFDGQKRTLLEKLLDIGEETKLFIEIKDIQDETKIVLSILNIQLSIVRGILNNLLLPILCCSCSN